MRGNSLSPIVRQRDPHKSVFGLRILCREYLRPEYPYERQEWRPSGKVPLQRQHGTSLHTLLALDVGLMIRQQQARRSVSSVANRKRPAIQRAAVALPNVATAQRPAPAMIPVREGREG